MFAKWEHMKGEIWMFEKVFIGLSLHGKCTSNQPIALSKNNLVIIFLYVLNLVPSSQKSPIKLSSPLNTVEFFFPARISTGRLE